MSSFLTFLSAMKRQRANTPSSSHHECRRLETSDDAIVETTSTSSLRVRNSDMLPIDLIMEIFKLLPVKTLVRFLCVSKLWTSIIRHRDFQKLYLTNSTKRSDRLFFTMKREEDGDCYFFSFQTQSVMKDEPLVATYHKTHLAYPYTINSSSVHDLICYGTEFAYGLVVYNTSTRRSITLPKFDPQSFVIKYFLCYDPSDGVYKVLCMTGARQRAEPKLVLQVLTLGIDNTWRIIEDGHTDLPINHHICINGVLYYVAYADIRRKLREALVIISFDVRSEKFDLIQRSCDAHDDKVKYSSTLISYEGKLAIMHTDVYFSGKIVLWVLEDAVRHEWLTKVFEFSDSWFRFGSCRCRPSGKKYRLVDVTHAGEFILAPTCLCFPPFFVLYYDPKRNSRRKVAMVGTRNEILRWNEYKPYVSIYLFSSNVESLMFL